MSTETPAAAAVPAAQGATDAPIEAAAPPSVSGKKRQTFDRSIVEGPVASAVWKIAWPTVLQNAIGGLQGIVDHALVGHYVGYTGNAAIGVSWQIFLVVIVFISSLFTGMGVLVSRAAGANDHDKVNRTVYQAFLTAVALAVGVLAPIGYVLSPTLLDLVNATPAVRGEALPFLQTMFLYSIGLLMFFMPGLLDRALELSDYRAKRMRFERSNAGAVVKRGIGFAAFMHGAGFTGSGEDHLASIVTIEATSEGRVRVLTSCTEIGQGTNTVFSQIAADALQLDVNDIDIAQPDTSAVPNSGPTVASRTCMVVGKLVESAALALRAMLREAIDPALPFAAACREYSERHGSLRASAQYQAPPGVHWDDERYEGDAYGTYAWAVYVAEVSVDVTTFEIRLDDFVAVQEVGRVINPVLAAGQIEGGVAQGIGWALFEHVAWREGRMANAQMTNYIIPTSMDLPPIRVHFEEMPYAHGPGGAKGIGELPMDGAAPAIANAVSRATGIDIRNIPITPERVLELMEAVRA